ncbi:hypothetical protein ACQPYH_19415 [Kribbella sp. CA-245084]|uniref:hypothetical protein n=1 Tax=Kribbella sp. CA-245084 TaxID=3239940 RepID=UPI003D91676E
MNTLYPKPPHLTVAVWSGDDDRSTFARACEVAAEFGCTPTGASEDGPGVSKVGYRGKGLGTVIVEHLFGPDTEAHPVAISLSAAALGWPEGMWTANDRKAAYKLAGWATDVLRELTARTGALYGSIAVEETLPTPSALRAGTPITSLPFLSAKLPPAALRTFQAAFPQTQPIAWHHGTFFPGWRPFARANPSTVDRTALRAASTALGNALSRRNHE